jgi:hypothetical protein
VWFEKLIKHPLQKDKRKLYTRREVPTEVDVLLALLMSHTGSSEQRTELYLLVSLL